MTQSFERLMCFPSSVIGSSHKISVLFDSSRLSQSRKFWNSLLSSSVSQMYDTSSPPKWCSGEPKYESIVDTKLATSS